MPSTLDNKVIIDYNNIKVTIDIYDTSLGKRFIASLIDNLQKKRILEKNFCFLGWADSKRDLNFLCKELNKSIEPPPWLSRSVFIGSNFNICASLTHQLA